MNQFKYISPKTKEEALRILNLEKSQTCLVAGCSNILPYIKDKILSDKLLVDISGIKTLKFIKENNENLYIGPLTTISELMDSVIIREKFSPLYQALEEFADPILRNTATIGGNLADASPAADTAPPLLVLKAELEIENQESKRIVELKDFFISPRKTILQNNEMITGIKIKNTSINKNGCFIKLGLRQAMAISLASIAMVLESKDEKLTDVRIAMGSLAPTPFRLFNVEDFLIGKRIDEIVIEEAMNKVGQSVSPISDVRASDEYRRYISGILFKRALNRLINQARG